MTICVAAICKGVPPNDTIPMVVGAADRMLTAGDIEFEPEQPKIVPLTTSIFALLAGDSALQTEIMQNVYGVVNGRATAQPANWWKVSEVADLYSSFYDKARSKRAEKAILTPLRLTHETFLEKQRMLSPESAHELTAQLQNFELQASVAAIFCGVDSSGAHIYVVRDSHVECRDVVGFAAIGAGDWHSNSQFMFANHTRGRSFAETLVLIYSAKKRAEVAPGVGEATDMFTVGPFLGHNVYPVGDHVLATLKAIYEATKTQIRQSEQKANQVATDFVAEILNAAPQTQAATPSASPTASAPRAEQSHPAA